jgi:hypothetical protein
MVMVYGLELYVLLLLIIIWYNTGLESEIANGLCATRATYCTALLRDCSRTSRKKSFIGVASTKIESGMLGRGRIGSRAPLYTIKPIDPST